jgi:hypothetical protein
MKKILWAAAVLLTTAAAWLPVEAQAQVGFTLEVGNAPPPERYEIIPPPRYGYEWVRGFWDWNGREYVWVPGYWIAVRDGYFYDAPRWFLYDGRWRLERGGWRPGARPPGWGNGYQPGQPPRPVPYPRPPHDRDHDGIPDHRDPDRNGNGIPDNREPAFRPPPGRGDRDHDGIPDYRDGDRNGNGIPDNREPGLRPPPPRNDRDRDGTPNRLDPRPNDPRRN